MGRCRPAVFVLPCQDKTLPFPPLSRLRSDRGRAPSRPSAASRRAALTGGCDPYNNDGGNGRLTTPSLPVDFSSRCRPASIRIFCEPAGSMPSWGPRFSRCCYLANGLQKSPRDGRSHLNSANFFFFHPDFYLCRNLELANFFFFHRDLYLCRNRWWLAVRFPQGFVLFSAHPELVQQHCQLSSHRYHRSFLGILSAVRGQLQTPAA